MYKLSGVIISDDLKWNTHVEYVIASSPEFLIWFLPLSQIFILTRRISFNDKMFLSQRQEWYLEFLEPKPFNFISAYYKFLCTFVSVFSNSFGIRAKHRMIKCN